MSEMLIQNESSIILAPCIRCFLDENQESAARWIARELDVELARAGDKWEIQAPIANGGVTDLEELRRDAYLAISPTKRTQSIWDVIPPINYTCIFETGEGGIVVIEEARYGAFRAKLADQASLADITLTPEQLPPLWRTWAAANPHQVVLLGLALLALLVLAAITCSYVVTGHKVPSFYWGAMGVITVLIIGPYIG